MSDINTHGFAVVMTESDDEARERIVSPVFAFADDAHEAFENTDTSHWVAVKRIEADGSWEYD